jgi:hypothetical protein
VGIRGAQGCGAACTSICSSTRSVTASSSRMQAPTTSSSTVRARSSSISCRSADTRRVTTNRPSPVHRAVPESAVAARPAGRAAQRLASWIARRHSCYGAQCTAPGVTEDLVERPEPRDAARARRAGERRESSAGQATRVAAPAVVRRHADPAAHVDCEACSGRPGAHDLE